MPINPLIPNSIVQPATPLGVSALPAATSPLTVSPSPLGTAGTLGVSSPLSGATPLPAATGINPQITTQILSIVSAMLQMLQGGALGGVKAAGAGAAANAAAPAAGGPLQPDQSIVSRANDIMQQGLNSITGIGAGQAKTAIQESMGKPIGQVNLNGVSANLNFSVNDLRDSLSYSKSLGLTAQNGRIDQAQLQAAISKAESSGAPANVVTTLKSLNDNWGAGEQLGIIQGGALTSGGVDTLMGILRNQAQGAAEARGGIQARVGGRAVTSVFNTIEQPVRQLIRDGLGL